MIFSKKFWVWGQITNLGVILGHISNFTQTLQIIYDNEALGISFLEKLVPWSSKATRGQKWKKGQISIFFKRRQILPQDEALELIFSKKLVSRAF